MTSGQESCHNHTYMKNHSTAMRTTTTTTTTTTATAATTTATTIAPRRKKKINQHMYTYIQQQ